MDRLDTWNELPEEWGEPIEELEMILLNDGSQEHTIHIGSKLNQVSKWHLISFLQKNIDLFAWTPIDMPDIDPSMMTHRLDVNPNYKSLK